jgi:hypothetical protein
MKMFKWALASMALTLVFACQKQIDKPGAASLSNQLTVLNQIPTSIVPCGTPAVRTIMDAGGLQEMGTAEIYNDGTNYYVTLTASEGRLLNQVVLNYGDSTNVDDALTKPDFIWFPCSGPKNWDVKETGLAVNTKTYTIPLTATSENCIYMHISVVTTNESGGQPLCGSTDDLNDTEDLIPTGSAEYQWFFKYCRQDCPPTECEPLRTQTPGGWGAKPEGNNPAMYLSNNFAATFPNGLKVGCETGYTITLTSAKAIEILLPTGGTPAALKASATDPASIKNELVGQLVALTLSVGFDNKYEDFGAGSNKLANMIIKDGTFAGKTVLEFWKIANDVLGGCSTEYTASQVNDMATKINENYVDGKMDNGVLVCTK